MARIDDQFQKVYNKIIPIVIVIPVLFLILFIVVSMLQLKEINTRIESGQSDAILSMNMSDTTKFSENHRQFLMLAILEEESLGERYRQGHYSLVSRSFKQFLGFFTGIIMVIVGAVFILLKLREKVDADVSKGESWKVSLVTNSPGVVFGFLGATLIAIASSNNDKITIRDSGLYLSREFLVAPYFTNSFNEKELAEYLKKYGNNQKDTDDVAISKPPQKVEGANKDKSNLEDQEKLMIQSPPKNK
jgi:hypothetical protein